MKTLMMLLLATTCVAGNCDNKLSWKPWIAQLERICDEHGVYLVGTAETTSAAWCRGLTPWQTFYKLRDKSGRIYNPEGWNLTPGQPGYAEEIQRRKLDEARDWRRFKKWLTEVREIAPRYQLDLHPGAEDEEEFFYLYCWQSADRSPVNAVLRAKRAWGTRKIVR